MQTGVALLEARSGDLKAIQKPMSRCLKYEPTKLRNFHSTSTKEGDARMRPLCR